MDIAQRIQDLRKAKGLSQEELADQIGVSRQAVSKWESAQSLPEYDKLIMLSDFFEVSTDYLMRGIVPAEAKKKREALHAGIFAVAGSAFTLIGLIVAVVVWMSEVTPIGTAIGLILMIMGCMIFGVGMYASDPETKAAAKAGFIALNVWVVPFIPFWILVNVIIQKNLWVPPYPDPLVNGWTGLIYTMIACLIYAAVCAAVSITQIRKLKKLKEKA